MIDEVVWKNGEKIVKEYMINNGYDVVLAYSGGKDSTYTLYLLKNKHRLRCCLHEL